MTTLGFVLGMGHGGDLWFGFASGVALHGREKMSNTLQTGRRRCLHLQNRIERCNEMKKKLFFFRFSGNNCVVFVGNCDSNLRGRLFLLLLLVTIVDRYQPLDKWCAQSFSLNEYRSYLRWHFFSALAATGVMSAVLAHIHIEIKQSYQILNWLNLKIWYDHSQANNLLHREFAENETINGR